MKITVDIIGGNEKTKFINEFMHYGDVFENGKHYCCWFSLTVEGTPDLNKLIPNIVNAWENKDGAKGYVIFAAIRSIDDIRVKDPKAYLKEGVQSLSMIINGKLSWVKFSDFLKHLGYKAHYDNHFVVKDVSYPFKRRYLQKIKI